MCKMRNRRFWCKTNVAASVAATGDVRAGIGLKRGMIIDMHTHAGRPRRTGDVDRSVLATMRRAGVAAAVVSAIGDIPMIRRNKEPRRLEKFREPNLGECL